MYMHVFIPFQIAWTWPDSRSHSVLPTRKRRDFHRDYNHKDCVTAQHSEQLVGNVVIVILVAVTVKEQVEVGAVVAAVVVVGSSLLLFVVCSYIQTS